MIETLFTHHCKQNSDASAMLAKWNACPFSTYNAIYSRVPFDFPNLGGVFETNNVWRKNIYSWCPQVMWMNVMCHNVLILLMDFPRLLSFPGIQRKREIYFGQYITSTKVCVTVKMHLLEQFLFELAFISNFNCNICSLYK